MSQLIPARDRHAEVVSVLNELEREGSIELDAAKEARFARQLGGHRFAIVDSNDRVVGYISGSFSGGTPAGHELEHGTVVAWVALVALTAAVRGKHLGREAVRQFAQRAHAQTEASLIGLNLDSTGDVARRRESFEHMGFRFRGSAGLAAICDL